MGSLTDNWWWRCVACMTLAFVLGVGPRTASAGVAGQQLTLPASWYEIVAAYDYDEARRFEAGQRRGAGVRTAGGIVRSPVIGSVRFSGSVAGRAVTTIDTMIDGQAAVVTFTGGRRRALRVGARVNVGDIVGVGARVHIGAYDPARRTRYLPVVAARGGAAGGMPQGGGDGAGARVRGAGPRIGMAVGERLVDLVNGEIGLPGSGAAGAGAGVRSPSAAGTTAGRDADDSGAVRRRADAPARVRGVQSHAVAPRSARRASSETNVRRRSAAQPVGHDRAVSGQTAARVRPDAERATAARGHRSTNAVSGTAVPGSAAPDAGGAAGARAGQGPHAQGPAASARPRRGGAAAHGTARSTAAAADTNTDTQITSDDVEQPRVTVTDGASATGHESPWRTPIMVVLGALLASIVGVAWGRRRRHTGGPVERPIAAALPVHVPSVGPYAYPVGDTEGASILPDVGLAWCEPDPGTDDEFQPPASAHVREPEHA